MKKAVQIGITTAVIITVLCVLFLYIREKNRLSSEPLFTSSHLTEEEMECLVCCYHFTCEPDFFEDYDMEQFPDFSQYELHPDEWTGKSIFVLNFVLFIERSEHDQEAIQYAAKLGITRQNPVTAQWVMQNPREAVILMEKLFDKGDYFLQKRNIQHIYSVWYDRKEIPDTFREKP